MSNSSRTPTGSGKTQLAQVIKQIGFNKGDEFLLGTVSSAPPNLRVTIDNTSLELTSADLIVAESLVEREETGLVFYNANGGISSDLSASPIVRIHYPSRLKVGDRVILADIQGGQQFVIIDKAVRI